MEPGGELSVLLTHRAALFLALVVLSGFALFDTGVRRAASVTLGISVVAFLVVYGAVGAPDGALRKIAIADGIALAPLALVVVSAWRHS
ncbi:MAG: hypothetical protein AAGE52_32120 [Myxococcota bacterium]